jgi:hypothetical protein
VTTKPTKRTTIAEPLSVLVLLGGLSVSLFLTGWFSPWLTVAIASVLLALAVAGFRTVARVR